MKYYRKPLPDFSSEAVWKDLKRQCYDGTIDYEAFPADEYKYFDRLRIIYLRFKFDNLPKEEAERQERLLSDEYSLSKKKAAQSLNICRKYQDSIKHSEQLKIQVNKAKSDRDKLIPALKAVGLLTDDESFYRINMEG